MEVVAIAEEINSTAADELEYLRPCETCSVADVSKDMKPIPLHYIA